MQTKMAPNNENIEILMAVRNNIPYLESQLESLLQQTYKNFHLSISDDASNDNSTFVIDRYLSSFQNAPVVYRHTKPSGSAKANFSFLLEQSEGDLVLFCDGDDIWHDEKIEVFINRFHELEGKHGKNVPMMIFSDATIIDGLGNESFSGYWDFRRINPNYGSNLRKSLMFPSMIGCATLINRPLIEYLLPIPLDDVTGHDWWAQLVAICFGVVDYIPQKTMSYRIHGANSSAPSRVTLKTLKSTADPKNEVRRRVRIRQMQAKALLECFQNELRVADRSIIEEFLCLSQEGTLKRKIDLATGGFLYPDIRRNVALMVYA